MRRLDRRLARLELVAEEGRLRPYRAFAADHSVPLAELMADIEDKGSLVDHLAAEGLTTDEIMKRCAAAWSVPLDELRVGCEDIGRRYFDG